LLSHLSEAILRLEENWALQEQKPWQWEMELGNLWVQKNLLAGEYIPRSRRWQQPKSIGANFGFLSAFLITHSNKTI
jgi:hypothetical protein